MNKSLQNIIKNIQTDGPESLHVLTDFDRTLTNGAQDGMKTPTLISLLRDGHHLSADYASRAIALFDTYHPIEIDPLKTVEEKRPVMKEWWIKHFNLMIECWLRQDDIRDVIEKSHLKLRKFAVQTLRLLNEKNIPVIIISAGAIGDAIPIFLEKNLCNFPNISPVCNQFIWDNRWRATAIKEPIIHVFNKDETIIEELPSLREKITKRKNVIIIGDSLWDVGMVSWFEYKNLLKIGFLNPESERMKTEYEKAYDILIENDEDFEKIYTLLQEILITEK